MHASGLRALGASAVESPDVAEVMFKRVRLLGLLLFQRMKNFTEPFTICCEFRKLSATFRDCPRMSDWRDTTFTG